MALYPTVTEAMYARRGLQERLAMAREQGAPVADIRWIEKKLREVERFIARDGKEG